MGYGARRFGAMSIVERLKIGKNITKLREEEGLSWPDIRSNYRDISINTAKKFIAEYKATLPEAKIVEKVEA